VRRSVPKMLRLLLGGGAIVVGLVMLLAGHSPLGPVAVVLVGLGLVLPTSWLGGGGGSEFADVGSSGDGGAGL
jgi:hypothetical protein